MGQRGGQARSLREHPRPALLIAGPTASGKSALAMRLAMRFGGVVINCDSMQVYADLGSSRRARRRPMKQPCRMPSMAMSMAL